MTAVPNPTLFSQMRSYVSGPRQAHEEVAWAVLARVVEVECSDLTDDARVRRELATRARRVSRIRQSFAAFGPKL